MRDVLFQLSACTATCTAVHCCDQVYLDQVSNQNLTDLLSEVRRSRNLVFVLSNRIFESEWCKQEAVAALQSGVPVVPVTYEDSRWGANHEHKFPPADVIPESIRPALSGISLKHDSEYLDEFMVRLVRRLGMPTVGPGPRQ